MAGAILLRPIKKGRPLKLKRYKCKFCKEHFEMSVEQYSQRSMTALKGVCTSEECMTEAAMKAVEVKRKKEKQRWERRKKAERDELKSLADWKKELQSVINEIVRLIDADKPCIATGRYTGQMHCGHFYSVGSYPSLRYHMWNLHKQCAESNTYKSGDYHLYRDGLIARYGLDRLDKIEELVGRYITLRITSAEIRDEFLPRAKNVLRRLKKGEEMTRDQVNYEIGIY